MTSVRFELEDKLWDRLDAYMEKHPEPKKEVYPAMIQFILDEHQHDFYTWFNQNKVTKKPEPPDPREYEEDVFGGTRPTSQDDLPDNTSDADLEAAQQAQPEKSIDDIFEEIDSLGEK